MAKNRPKSRIAFWKLCIACLLCFLTAVQVLAKQKPNGVQKERRKAEGFFTTNPYLVWLQEEVGYIVTDSEIAQFKPLDTDADRERFIAKFWERRNPHPGSPENAFKTEYYRRIAFANEHFASDIPGWKTDRGRIYIEYGPPDAVDSHPSGGTTLMPEAGMEPHPVPYPYEVWRYSHLGMPEKVVEVRFVDRQKNGNFVRALRPGEEDPLQFIPHSGLPDHSSSEDQPSPPGAGTPRPE